MGAPTSDTLDWDKDELLDKPVFPFHDSDVHHQINLSLPEQHVVKWRSLQGKQTDQPEQDSPARNEEALFVTTEDLGPVEGQELSLFYDHSFSIHEASEVSVGILSGESMEESGLQGDSTVMSIETSSDGEFPPIQGGLSDLKDIPNAGYLQSIIPQTMTVNLIVGIITIYPPRRVVTRQWKREQDLVEMVVADETKTGFNVTFWLPPATSGTMGRNETGPDLSGLRPRDIILLRMVGLSSFRERVYGQSLRKEMTKVDLLHRQPVDATDVGGIYSLRRIHDHTAREDDQPLTKVRRVREWIKRFVEDGVGRESESGHRHRQPLPPDTQ